MGKAEIRRLPLDPMTDLLMWIIGLVPSRIQISNLHERSIFSGTQAEGRGVRPGSPGVRGRGTSG